MALPLPQSLPFNGTLRHARAEAHEDAFTGACVGAGDGSARGDQRGKPGKEGDRVVSQQMAGWAGMWQEMPGGANIQSVLPPETVVAGGAGSRGLAAGRNEGAHVPAGAGGSGHVESGVASAGGVGFGAAGGAGMENASSLYGHLQRQHNEQAARTITLVASPRKNSSQGQEAASPKPPRSKQLPAAQLPPLVKGTEDVTAAAAAGGRAAAGLVPRRMASAVVQTTPRLLESPRLDLSLALTGAGLEWLFGSKWQWFAGSRGEGQLELCLDGSLICPSAGQHAHWWTDEQGRVNLEWGNRLGLHVLIMDRSKNKMTGVRVSGSVTVEALLISLDPEAQKAAVAAVVASGLTPGGGTTSRSSSSALLPQIHEQMDRRSNAESYASSAGSSSSAASPYRGPSASGGLIDSAAALGLDSGSLA